MGSHVECAMPIAPGSRPSDEATPLSLEPSPVIERVDEAALLARASDGDEAAFSELYARYQRQIRTSRCLPVSGARRADGRGSPDTTDEPG